MTADAAQIFGVAFARMEPWSRYPISAEALASYFAAEEIGAPRFMIVRDGALAGVLGLREHWLRGPYIQFLGLVPECQGQRLGQRALAWFEGRARAANFRNLWVAASDFNVAAIAFYERHGYVRVARIDDLIQDGIAEILLRKRLL
jgi:diamine N-acetyltransferase